MCALFVKTQWAAFAIIVIHALFCNISIESIQDEHMM